MITLKNECSLNAMKSIKDNSIDLVLTDPPYNICSKNNLTKKGNKFVSNAIAWGEDFQDNWNTFEEYWAFLKPFIIEMKRVVKETGSIVLFLDRKYTGHIIYLIENELELKFKNKVYFEKTNPTPSANKTNYLSTVEEAVWFRKPSKLKEKQKTFNFGIHSEMFQFFRGGAGSNKKTTHPCEKYEWMLEPLIKALSNEGDTILDPFAGSGAVLRMARKMKRQAVGFEKNSAFYDMACNQLNINQVDGKRTIVEVEEAANEDDFKQSISTRKNQIIEEVMKAHRFKQPEIKEVVAETHIFDENLINKRKDEIIKATLNKINQIHIKEIKAKKIEIFNNNVFKANELNFGEIIERKHKNKLNKGEVKNG